jgi:DTW domain-containing protein YfiP
MMMDHDQDIIASSVSTSTPNAMTLTLNMTVTMTDKAKDPPEPSEKHSQDTTGSSMVTGTRTQDTSTGTTLQQTGQEEALTEAPPPINNNHDESLSAATEGNNNNNKRRLLCDTCDRPTPKACICQGLPASRIRLRTCHILVLQHPHEKRRKNCSLPLVQLCLAPESITVVVSRRLGDQVDPKAMALLQQHSRVLLIFPTQSQAQVQVDHDQDNDNNINNDNNNNNNNNTETLSLSQAQEYCRSTTSLPREEDDSINHNKVLIVILDATWKYAREMDKANIMHQQYPKHMKRVELAWDDPLRPQEAIIPKRFDIRTPPSQIHFSTAECIAWIITALEFLNEQQQQQQQHDVSLYATLMKPLDVMVAKWHDCRHHATNNHHPKNKTKNNNKTKDDDDGRSKNDRQQRQQQQKQDESNDDDYSYYSNPSHTPRILSSQQQGQGEEDPSVLSRTTFFTMGDVDAKDGKKQYKSGKRRWKK